MKPRVIFEANNPETFRLIYNESLERREREVRRTTYGIQVTRQVELTFHASPDYPGNDSLQLYLECVLPNNDDVDYYKFCELALRRMHHHNNNTVTLCVEMLDRLAEEMRDYYQSFELDDETSDELSGMITHANELAMAVLEQFQDAYDAFREWNEEE